MNKDYTSGLVRNRAWVERRKALMRKYGRPALNDINPVCRVHRYVPCKQKGKVC